MSQLLLVACSSPQSLPVAPVSAGKSVVHTEIGAGPVHRVPIHCNGETQHMWLQMQTPSWPASAPEQLVSASVLVGFTINQQGATEQLQVINASDEHFIEPALTLVRNAKFEFAAELSSCVVGLPMQLPIRFELD